MTTLNAGATARTVPWQPADSTRSRPLTNGELLVMAREGDRAAWEQLVQRHTRLLWAVARGFRLSAADSADVVQTTWLRLAEHLHRLHSPEAVSGWLATTVRTECLTLLREQVRERPTAVASDVPSPDAGPEQLAEDADLVRCVRAALSRLPERDQCLLRALSANREPGYAAVAAALDMPVGSIGPSRARALARLRAELGAEASTLRSRS